MTKAKNTSKLESSMRRAVPRGGNVVLAVSGGLDSMVLLDVAADLAPAVRCTITVATFDHASGTHSQRAASFVASRASDYGLPAVIGRAAGARRTEASWRAARWEFLRSVARATNGVVLTGHTRDDQLETVLMRALRGAGARGLAGLLAPSEVRRPFVELSRGDLHEHATRRGLDWLEDPTNRSVHYFRNRVRRDLLPALRRAQASFDAELLGLSRRAAAWRTELSGLVDRGIRHAILIDERGRPMLDVAAEDLTGYSRSMLGIVWPELAARVGVTLDARGTRRAAEFTISSRTGGRMQLAGSWELVRSRAWFEVRPAREARAVATEALPLDPPMRWDRWTFRFGERDGKRDAWSASFPADAVLDVRVWRPGDRLKIHYGGRLIARKVKYFLSDAGISGHIRPRWPVVVAGDEILWIPGVRRSDAATARSGRPVVTYVCDYLDRRS